MQFHCDVCCGTTHGAAAVMTCWRCTNRATVVAATNPLLAPTLPRRHGMHCGGPCTVLTASDIERAQVGGKQGAMNMHGVHAKRTDTGTRRDEAQSVRRDSALSSTN